MNFLGLGQNATIEIALDSLEGRKLVEVKADENTRTLLPVFYNGESLSGKVTISVKRNGKLEYQGIKIEFIGQIDFFADRGSRDEFLNRTQELARPGILSQSATYPFHFADVEKPFESYIGSNVQLRYFLRVTIVRRFMDITKEMDIVVHSFFRPPQPDTNIQMEVGIEESLHIEFEYNKSCYHLEDEIILYRKPDKRPEPVTVGAAAGTAIVKEAVAGGDQSNACQAEESESPTPPPPSSPVRNSFLPDDNEQNDRISRECDDNGETREAIVKEPVCSEFEDRKKPVNSVPTSTSPHPPSTAPATNGDAAVGDVPSTVVPEDDETDVFRGLGDDDDHSEASSTPSMP
nr:unnamed protein product [Spirometra erinaceieuropaei]